MKHANYMHKNEGGSVLAVALILLSLLTLLGVVATRTAENELRISGNDKCRKIAFYAADSGWQVGATWLDSQVDPSGIDGQEDGDTMPGNSAVDYTYEIGLVDITNGEGFSTEFKQFNFEIDSTGRGPGNCQAEIKTTARKAFYAEDY